MKTQAFRRKPLTIKVYNRALSQCYKHLYVCTGQALGLFFLGILSKFYPLLAILLIVELIRLYFAWMQVEAVRDGEVDYLVGLGEDDSYNTELPEEWVKKSSSEDIYKAWKAAKEREEQ